MESHITSKGENWEKGRKRFMNIISFLMEHYISNENYVVIK